MNFKAPTAGNNSEEGSLSGAFSAPVIVLRALPGPLAQAITSSAVGALCDEKAYFAKSRLRDSPAVKESVSQCAKRTTA
jgi:hypothetical protein